MWDPFKLLLNQTHCLLSFFSFFYFWAGGKGDDIQDCPLGSLIPKAISSAAWMNKCLIKTWSFHWFSFCLLKTNRFRKSSLPICATQFPTDSCNQHLVDSRTIDTQLRRHFPKTSRFSIPGLLLNLFHWNPIRNILHQSSFSSFPGQKVSCYILALWHLQFRMGNWSLRKYFLLGSAAAWPLRAIL